MWLGLEVSDRPPPACDKYSGGMGGRECEAAALEIATAAAKLLLSSCFGDVLAESSDGAGDSVTELVCDIKWDRLGNVSEAELFNSGQWLANGDVGVISPGGRGVNGELGEKARIFASRRSSWRML